MTAEEMELLKQWLTCEELRLAQSVEDALTQCFRTRSVTAAVHYYQLCVQYKEFMRCMRAIDMLLHLYP